MALPSSKMLFMAPPIFLSKVSQASEPANGEIKPAMMVGTFIDFHCLTRMPLWGMSKTGMMTCAPLVRAFIKAEEKSDVPVG